jgi:glycosyltransferase involved in cell wall biosynthesis
MKISVITAVYNGAETIEDTINSVAGQTYSNVEHIIIDGLSTDDTMSIVNRRRNDISVVVSEADTGIYDAMNKGIAIATGDVIGTLNADDMYENDQVLERVAELFSDPKLDACYANLVYVDRVNLRKVVRYWTSQPFEPGLFFKGWIPAHPTFFVRKAVYDHCGGFDLEYKIQSDFELTLRLLELHRIRSLYVPEIWVRMRMGGATNNSILNIIKGNLEAYKACKKHQLKVSPLFFVTKIAARVPQFFRRP